jgi:hypothetical protein
MRAVSAFIIMLAASLTATFAHAHGPTRQKAFESIIIKASPDAVWAKVKDFTQLQGWHPAVESTSAHQWQRDRFGTYAQTQGWWRAC